jgi:hypothetical protein
MRKLIFLVFMVPGLAFGQYVWNITQKADMPIEVSNNAVVGAKIGPNGFVYSFCGIDSSLSLGGIHLKALKYDVTNDQWALLPDVPDTLGKVAAGASLVDTIIYVIGGYHVFNAAPFELSSNKVHRFNIKTDSWLSDGADIPTAIDDHVQVVWRDSLIYLVTGWSNTTNVPLVQIYDPANDNWLTGTPVPDNNDYKAFGASGDIIGDTIYYYGGASNGVNFPAQSEIRKGAIDPMDPTQINWIVNDNTPGPIYRSAGFKAMGAMHWLGGSAVSYNYDADAYNGSGIVPPLAEIRSLSGSGWSSASTTSSNMEVMDLRGIARIKGTGSFFIAGGIGPNATCLKSTFEIKPVPVSIPENDVFPDVRIFPNPASEVLYVEVAEELSGAAFQVENLLGQQVQKGVVQNQRMVIDVKALPEGSYYLKLSWNGYVRVFRFWSVK